MNPVCITGVDQVSTLGLGLDQLNDSLRSEEHTSELQSH